MDPYVEIKTSKGTQKTTVKDDAGTTPVWNETIELELHKIENQIDFIVMEEDTTCCDFVGSTSIEMASLCTKKPLQQWIEISFEGKSAGKLHIKTEFFPYPPGQLSQFAAFADLSKKEPEIDYDAIIYEKEAEILAKDAII